jgi:hypothetical protein
MGLLPSFEIVCATPKLFIAYPGTEDAVNDAKYKDCSPSSCCVREQRWRLRAGGQKWREGGQRGARPRLRRRREAGIRVALLPPGSWVAQGSCKIHLSNSDSKSQLRSSGRSGELQNTHFKFRFKTSTQTSPKYSLLTGEEHMIGCCLERCGNTKSAQEVFCSSSAS